MGSEAGPVLQPVLILVSDRFLATSPTPVHFVLVSSYLVYQDLPTMWTDSLLSARILRVREVLTNHAIQHLLPVTKSLSISYGTFINCRNSMVFVFPTFFLLSQVYCPPPISFQGTLSHAVSFYILPLRLIPTDLSGRCDFSLVTEAVIEKHLISKPRR